MIIIRELIDLTGKRFGSLTVIDRAPPHRTPSGQVIAMWNCECECGKHTVVSSQHLRDGDVISCGCSKHKHPKNFKDLSGMRFGSLTVISDAGSHRTSGGQYKHLWKCLCDCGNETIVFAEKLTNGGTISCGCQKGLHIHNLHNTRVYSIHQHMLQRCENPNNDAYMHYGGRGIKVCDEWHDVKCFYEWAMSNGYDSSLTIDRIDVNGDYEPSNCRWVSRKEQSNNRRCSVSVTHNGETHTISEWADILNMPYDTLYQYHRRGRDIQSAIKHFMEDGYEPRTHKSIPKTSENTGDK